MNFYHKFRSLFWKEKLEADMAEEMRLHLELQTELNRKAGMNADEARYAAHRQFGNVAGIQEKVRAQRGWVWLEELFADLRFATRSLYKNPGFTLVVVLILALGIGANTAVFTVIDALMLRSLPIREPGKMVLIAAAGSIVPNREFPYPLFEKEGNNLAFPYQFYEQFAGQSQTLAEVAAVSGWFPLRPMVASGFGGTEVESVEAEEVTGNYFSALGVRAALGRTLGIDDDRPGNAAPVAVISHDFWQRRFNSDSAVIGKTLRFDTLTVTIVGVLDRGFSGGQVGGKVKLWFPLQLSPLIDGNIPWGSGALKSSTLPWIHILGRLRDGVSRDQAALELDVLYQAKLGELDPRRKGLPASREREHLLEQKIAVVPAGTGYAGIRPAFERPASILMITVIIMQLVACANVAGLLLARGTVRQREFALRTALGASRWRLVRQLMTESLLLAVIAGLLGLLFAEGGTHVLANLVEGLELWADRRVLLFACTVTVVTGFIFGLIPALRLSRRELTGMLKDQSGAGRQRLNFALVVAQIAFAFMLVAVAGLFARTLRNLSVAETGYQPVGRQLFDLNVTPDYHAEQRHSLYQRLTAAIGALPGVDSATVYQGLGLLGDTAFALRFSVSGYVPARDEVLEASIALVGPRFFETMGISLVRGRDFGVRDEDSKSNGAPAIVISEWSARKLFGPADPVGKRIKLEEDYEIVGVAKDAKYDRLRESPRFVFYCPMVQRPNSFRVTFAVKTAGAQPALIPSLRKTVAGIDPEAQISGVRTIDDQINHALQSERLIARLTGFFGTFALTFSGMGLFGLMSYAVSRRTREFGVRLALGAPVGSLWLMVARQGFALGLLGCLLGWIGAWACTRFIGSLLYQVPSTDLPTFAAAVVLLLLVALLSCLLPAVRATKVDPVVTLRAE